MDFIITPTYNERENIKILLEKIFALYPAIHVLVVDDNSPDGTAEVVKELQNKYFNLHLKERPGKLGLASAYLESFRYVLKEFPNIQSIITMDTDLSHDPLIVGTMLKELQNYDLVLGSRYVKGGGVTDWKLWRRMLSRWGNIYARLITRSKIHDLTTGFHCYRAELLKRYDLDSIDGKGFAFLMEMKIIAERLGARIREIPIIFPGRINGQSKLNNNIIYEGLVMPWKLRYRQNRKPSVIV